ncbi:LacI family DNA-binding transcriptional regulator [Microbacterium sp. che218]|uniref:LacI family DNA-binding transcriptional regulator n=1 Tax=Microbacterium sp. che218 TaxID=3140649 RepID=UPI00336BEC7D
MMTPLSGRPDARGGSVTIRDVAHHAGVGIKTVSRVINNEPNVAKATAARIRASIAELQWEPDAHAANLRRIMTRTQSLGLLLGNVANPFSATIHRAVEDLAIHRDVAVFASSLDDDPDREVAAIAAFVRRKVDGLILTCVADSQRYLQDVIPESMPVVFIDREPTDLPADLVHADNVGGTALATRHVLGYGHRTIALLIDRHDIWTAAERERGFRQAVAEFSLPESSTIIVRDLTDQGAAERAVMGLMALPTPPTAIVSGQNLITIGAVHALRRLGRHHDVALIGFDDVELADLMEPGISVIAQRPQEIGVRAAEMLFESLDGVARMTPRRIVVPVDLIPRGSGEIRPK